MRTWLARTGLILLSAAACIGSGACAEERAPIDKVQPNALPKSFFVGENLADGKDDPEFRTKSYVVGSSVSQSDYAIGEFSVVDRIRWEITEDMLLGRRAYQESPGADNRGVPNSQVASSTDKNVTATPNGTIVAAYKIKSHFDIRRAYNPSTGEESNVIEENSSDRPWNERAFFRVDWSQNLVVSTNDSTAFSGSTKVTPVAYDVTDPSNEDAPHLEIDGGYLDVTNKFTVEPAEIEFSWGTMKRCMITSFMTGTSTYDCNPQEAVVRTSFARVSPNEDFEPFEDDYAWQDVVGNTGGEGNGYESLLGVARTKWDPQYSFNDAQTQRLKSIHNVWQKSHLDTTCHDNTDEDGDGTADACSKAITGYKGKNGSQCDTVVGKCTIPVRDRTIKTIAYTLNKEAPDAFQDTVDKNGKVAEEGTFERIGHAWRQLLEVAIAYRRETECRRTGDGDRDTCHTEFFESDSSPNAKQMVVQGGWLTDAPKKLAVDQGMPMFYVCHNPVRAYDPESLCGKPGSTPRFGDIRRNWLVYWPYESRAHYGGIGWNPPDPVTGETFGASATIMGRSATYAAANERDIIQLAIGDLAMDDIVAGVPAQRYAKTLQSGASAPEAFRIGRTSSQIASRVGAVDMSALKSTLSVRPPTVASALEGASLDSIAKAKSTVAATQFTADIGSFATLTQRLQGTVSTLDELTSPLRGLEPAKLEALRAWWEEDMAARGACFLDANASSTGSLYLPSLAGYFREKYADLSPTERGQRIYDDLVKETIVGIGTHEVGHSLGLRHNFASSWDAPNFNPQYWQLRTNEGRATGACSEPRNADNADTCMGPRYLDPMTKDEQGLDAESRPGIDYFANTSTMEYQVERGGESVGLGTYDQHAMKVLYGRVIETFDDRVIPKKDQENFGLKNYTQLQERDLVINGRNVFTHYTTTGRLMKVFDAGRDCREATDEEKAISGWRVVHGKVCAPPPKDHGAFGDFESGPHPLASTLNLVKWRVKDGNTSRVRWNYRWGEQYGAGGYMHTTMMDAGADVYELTQNLTRSFDLRYPWTYFRRGNREWNDMYLPQSVAAQYFGRLRAYHWQIALDLARSSPSDLNSDDGLRPYVMSQADIFAFLQRAILMPEPGGYVASPLHTSPRGRSIFDLSTGTAAANFSIGVGDGRFIADDFENEKGGSWNYQQYVHHAGYETEKALAMMQLVDPRPTLFTVARENYLDGRDVMISFRNDLPDSVDRMLGGLLSEDWEAIAPYVTGDASGGLYGFEMTDKAFTRPQGAMLVFPNVGYKQELSMAIYGATFSRLSSDMTLVNKMRISALGDATPTIPGTREVRFTNPESGITYVASSYGTETIDGRSIDHGIGSRMLGHANDLLAQAYKVVTDASGAPVLDENGEPKLVLDESGKPITTGPDAILAFRRYMGLVDATRQIGRALDGPLAQ
ncbi:hypothetical protein AKJ09_03030 [Labilithrix luteola]|uniref:EcxA zinc-binding domain-containing protein n=1 Tax=Labilithrix luteola TaxID=1391654 RepID=A0A0K1PSM3_9BACT|nr:zinc-dependent metalloprotease [Labilithrix luteola]AKU96366.1 hypothetical protein AKJ09_03030 [Labilithrix luteola]